MSTALLVMDVQQNIVSRYASDAEYLPRVRRVSAFAGSDLDVVLRAGDVDTLVLTGIATSGVVLSTLRQAADLDYKLIVLAENAAGKRELGIVTARGAFTPLPAPRAVTVDWQYLFIAW